MCCDINCNSIQLLNGTRIVAGFPIIPYPAYFQPNGNFLLLTTNEALPDYNEFGITQTLIYLSAAEITAAALAADTGIGYLTLDFDFLVPLVGALVTYGMPGSLDAAGTVSGLVGSLIETGDNGHWAGNP